MMKNNIDILIVGLGMAIGFTVVIMHLTGFWPCSIINGIEKMAIPNNIKNISLSTNNASGMKNTNNMIYYLESFFRCT